jgi:hypothetical protein
MTLSCQTRRSNDVRVTQRRIRPTARSGPRAPTEVDGVLG